MSPRTVIACLLLPVLAGCACRKPVPPICPTLPPVPPAVMAPQEGNFLERLEQRLTLPSS